MVTHTTALEDYKNLSCMGGWEKKSVMRITGYYHKACGMIQKCDYKGQIFFIPSSHE